MKYIVKISKKFILLILMIVLPINSFAAVSVSDGSAFVSKSEFSSTINNISNRMSTIENTLDAKIDSLVSSYLSRNGIWNGDKQTLNSTRTWNFSPPALEKASSVAYTYDGEVANTKIINNTTKSGLLVGFMYYKDGQTNYNSNSSRWGYRFYQTDTGNWKSDSGFVLTGLFYEGSILKYSYVIGSVVGAYNNDDLSLTLLPITLPSQEIMIPFSFFVSKGSEIRFKIGLNAHLVNVKADTSPANLEHRILVGIKDEFYVY